jgi:NitT/TauT family transport system ATP-binding protein
VSPRLLPREERPVAIAVKEVSKTYGRGRDAVVALDRVGFEVNKGEIVCIVGASGCGKSTLLHLIAGLEKPTAGALGVSGGGTSLMFQDPALFPWLSVRENVEYALRLKGLGSDEIRETAASWLAKVRLSAFADAQPHELSGGMRHRAALARALACQPDVLLADEPFGALDAQMREILQKELELVWTELGNTFVFVTHNVREAVFLADRVIVLSARPGTPIEEYRISTPRPRSFEDVLVAKVVVDIHEHLAKEVERAAREEGL